MIDAFGAPASSAAGDSASEGYSGAAARADHKHAREAFATTSDIADVAATESAGSSATVPRGDHVHALPALGAWTDWTPTVTQSGSVTFTITRAKYVQIGKTVHLMADLSITGTGTAANDVVIGALPVSAAASSFQTVGSMCLFDTSTGDDFTGVLRFVGTNNTLIASSTRANGRLGAVSFTAALASGDAIRLNGTYEAA